MEAQSKPDVSKYLLWIKEGRSFSEIREDLKRLGLTDEQINMLVKKIDDAAQHVTLKKEERFHKTHWIAAGCLLVVVSAVIGMEFNRQITALDIAVLVVSISAGITLITLGMRKKNDRLEFKRPMRRKYNRNH